MAWPKAGTVSVVNGSAIVTGTGTSFFGSAQAGWGFVGPDGRVYEVLAVSSGTLLTITPVYQGATAAGQIYALFPTMSLAHDVVASVQALAGTFQAVADGPGQGKFSTDVVKLGDEDTGLGWPSSNEVALKAGGDWQLRLKDGAASGAAVQSDPLDQTAGRLLLSGAYGANKSVAVPSGNIDLAVVGGIYHGYGGAHASASTGDNPFPALNGAYVLRVENLGIGGAGEYLAQTVTAVSGPDQGHKRTRIINTSGNGFSDWFDDYSAAKEPDVYGSNPSGQYLKMSNGTLIMWRDRIPITITNAVSAAWTGSFPTTYTGGIALVPSAGGGNISENDFGSYLPTGRVASGAPDLRLRHVSGTARSDTLYGGYTAFTRWK
ncbi:hypothetical protein [Leisingera sp. M523]|uniref:hypothetical protein n=1 Tax=Leisingera sp. M523 TaxID=2867013 RepID=UPI0021A5D2EF|nr:hypothetical protein [Leisingera sp. M523]UWQ27290.1 hypothetical protein K3557_10640 [Leisingera sp. M523]